MINKSSTPSLEKSTVKRYGGKVIKNTYNKSEVAQERKNAEKVPVFHHSARHSKEAQDNEKTAWNVTNC